MKQIKNINQKGNRVQNPNKRNHLTSVETESSLYGVCYRTKVFIIQFLLALIETLTP